MLLSPLNVNYRISPASLSSLCHSSLFLLESGEWCPHLFWYYFVLNLITCKNWVLWGASWPCTFCVSSGFITCALILSLSRHFIWLWCIFRPCFFLQIFIQAHLIIIYRLESVLIGYLILTPSQDLTFIVTINIPTYTSIFQTLFRQLNTAILLLKAHFRHALSNV